MRYLIAKKTEEKVSFQSNGKTRDYSEIAIGQIRSLLGGDPQKRGKRLESQKENKTTQHKTSTIILIHQDPAGR